MINLKHWTFLKMARFWVSVAFGLFALGAISIYLLLNETIDVLGLRLLVSALWGLAFSFVPLISAFIFYLFHFVFRSTTIENAEQMKMIWRNFSKEERKKYLICCFVGGVYPALILIPVVVILSLRMNYLGYALCVLFFILLSLGTLLVRRKVVKSLSFIHKRLSN